MNKGNHYIHTLYYQIEQTAKYCRNLGAQLFSKYNLEITVDEFTTLDTLSLNEEICQRDLAKLILKDRPATGRILCSLENKKLIKRFTDTKNNRRVRKVLLTDKGKKILNETANIIRKYIDKIPKVLSEQKIKEMKENMREFRESLEQEVEMNI